MFAPDDWLADRAGVHKSTVRRWRAAQKFPPALERLAELELGGELGKISAAWDGWRLDRHGELVSPAGDRFTPGIVLALAIRLQQLHELERLSKAERRGALAVALQRLKDRFGGIAR